MEEWRAIQGYEGLYQVSSRGRIKATFLARSHDPVRILNPSRNSSGRRQLRLFKVGIPRLKLVAVLVADAFLGRKPIGLEVNHKDGNPCNDAATNLEYITHRENCAHAGRLGLRKKYPVGVDHHNARLTPAAVRHIRSSPASHARLARYFGVTPRVIRQVRNKETWAHVI